MLVYICDHKLCMYVHVLGYILYKRQTGVVILWSHYYHWGYISSKVQQ